MFCDILWCTSLQCYLCKMFSSKNSIFSQHVSFNFFARTNNWSPSKCLAKCQNNAASGLKVAICIKKMVLLWQQCNTLMQHWQDACNNERTPWAKYSLFWYQKNIDYPFNIIPMMAKLAIAKYLQFLDCFNWEICLHLKNKYPHQVQQSHHSK